MRWKAKKLGIDSKFIKLAGKINDNRPEIVFNNIKKKLNQRKSKFKNILFIGLAYKKNCDDLRNTPVLKIIKRFKKMQSKIYCYDPYVNMTDYPILKKLITKQLKYLSKKNLKEFDVVIIGTDHDNIEYNLIKKYSNLIFDTRNIFRSKQKNIIKI